MHKQICDAWKVSISRTEKGVTYYIGLVGTVSEAEFKEYYDRARVEDNLHMNEWIAGVSKIYNVVQKTITDIQHTELKKVYCTAGKSIIICEVLRAYSQVLGSVETFVGYPPDIDCIIRGYIAYDKPGILLEGSNSENNLDELHFMFD